LILQKGFKEVHIEQVHKMVMALDYKKKTGGPIPSKTLQCAVDIVSPVIKDCINSAFRSCIFPSKLKLAEIIPIPKIGDSQGIGDYRPISILPTISKLFEKSMAEQLSQFFQSQFSILLCGFRKNHSTQHALYRLLNSWQSSLDDGKLVGTILMDLSKAYDCLPHDLLIAKLAAYGVDFDSLSLLYDYLSKRFHRVKVGIGSSEWLEQSIGVPQGSILGPLLFNIFLNDLFSFIQETDICNFADDNSLYVSGENLAEIIPILQRETSNVLNWFKINSMTANPAKFQAMFLGNREEGVVDLYIDGVNVKTTSCVKLLGVNIDCKLNFRSHVEALCKTASQKVKALLRIRPYLNIFCTRRLCDAYILSTFNYCPLIWMNGCKSNDGLINKVHKRALSAIYRDFHSSFFDLLEKDKSVKIHVRNLRTLLIEVFKSLNQVNPKFMWKIFVPKSMRYSLRSGKTLKLPTTNTQRYGLNSLAFRGSMLWNSLPSSLKVAKNLAEFKRKVKNWVGDTCSCQICA
jgi:hypothetical protein